MVNLKTHSNRAKINPNVAEPYRGKTRQSAPNVGARRLGQDEQYLPGYFMNCCRETAQMARYHASAAVFTGLGMQH
jgi:hypothetical protein